MFISDSWICSRAVTTKIDSRIVALFSITVLNESPRLMHVREQKRDRRYRTSLVVRIRIRNFFRRLSGFAILFVMIWFLRLLEPHRNDLKSHVVIFASSKFELNVCRDRCNHVIRLTIVFISKWRLLQSLFQWFSFGEIAWSNHSSCRIFAVETTIDDSAASIVFAEISMIMWLQVFCELVELLRLFYCLFRDVDFRTNDLVESNCFRMNAFKSISSVRFVDVWKFDCFDNCSMIREAYDLRSNISQRIALDVPPKILFLTKSAACRNHIRICSCEICCVCNHIICTVSIASLRRAIMIR